MPDDKRETQEVKELAAWGCKSFMHIVRLNAPYIEGEGNSRDFDFTREGIRVRWGAGYDDTRRVLAEQPWKMEVDPMAGVAVYDSKPAHLTFSAGHSAT
jgi:NTE family protein